MKSSSIWVGIVSAVSGIAPWVMDWLNLSIGSFDNFLILGLAIVAIVTAIIGIRRGLLSCLLSLLGLTLGLTVLASAIGPRR